MMSTIGAIEQGWVDLAWLNWIGYLLAHQYDMELALTSSRFGNPYYQSQVWTHNETGFSELSDLEGVQVCYTDPSSVSGYIIPAMMLKAAGVESFGDGEFVGSHPEVIERLYWHTCDAGATFFDARTMVDYPYVNDVVVPLEISPQIPMEGFSIASRLPNTLSEALMSALLEIVDTEEGFALLEIIGGGSDGLVQTDHTFYSGIEELIFDAGLTTWEMFDMFYP
jgi:phosphonate transport system substrate-binding protein